MALVKDFSKIAGSSFINLLLGIVTTPLITRLVEPEQYGNWSLFTIYSNILASILLLGMDYIIVRYYYVYNDNAYRKQLIMWCILVPTTAIVLTFFPIILSLSRIRPTWSWFILFLLVVNVWVNVLNRLINLILRFENKINILSITTILHKIIFVAIVITTLFCVSNYKFEVLSVATALSTIITVFASVYFVRFLFLCCQNNIKYNLQKGEMISYGLPLMVSGCAYLLFQATDKLVIGRFCSEKDLGIYSSAASFLSLFAILQSSFTTVWWPSAMKNFECNSNDRSLYIKANDTICFVMTMIGFTFIMAKDLIILLLGDHYRSAVVILPFIIFQPILYTISETTVVGLNFLKKSKAQLWITISSLAFNIGFNVFLTKYYGIIGTSIAVGLSYVFFLALRTIISNYYFKVQYHFTKMYISVLLLFMLALIHTFFPGELFSYLIVAPFYITIIAMYKDVVFFLYNKSLVFIKRDRRK